MIMFHSVIKGHWQTVTLNVDFFFLTLDFVCLFHKVKTFHFLPSMNWLIVPQDHLSLQCYIWNAFSWLQEIIFYLQDMLYT